MKFSRFHLAGVLILIALSVLAACAPVTTTNPPAAVPTNPPPATAMPPTSAPPPTEAAPTGAPATQAATVAAPVAKAVTLQLVKNDQLGTFLADGDGNTLYLFTKDVKGTSNCYDKCAQQWPAVIPAGDATLKEGVASSLIGTTERKDGTKQLMYNGWPLYYYAKDKAPGDVVGQAVGKVWWVISGEGNPIKPAGLTVVSNDKFGKFLADDAGMSLYMFTKDTPNTTVCYDKCEVQWPPLLTLGNPTLGEGVDASKLGTTTRKDGTVQVTFNGMPLYYYFKDKAAGDVTGQNVGTVWYVVAPDGSITKTAP